jgi:hypothetical protein
MSTTKKNKFYWNEDTLNHFKFNSSYQNKNQTIKEITLFVENECSLEDNETEEMLINDLINQVYNTN